MIKSMVKVLTHIQRNVWLEKEGCAVVRFWDNEVLTNTSGVLEVIRRGFIGHPPLNPLPSREGK
ncbi:MAG: DUF559 domain-containing protein [Nitrospirae bacterium]|nr:DUF559 domain-containing protein [Nitrospirota bacterium]